MFCFILLSIKSYGQWIDVTSKSDSARFILNTNYIKQASPMGTGARLRFFDGGIMTTYEGVDAILLDTRGLDTGLPVLPEDDKTSTASKFFILPVDCRSGPVTIDPPTSPLPGDWFAVIDSRAFAHINNITINTSSDLLYGLSEDFVMNGVGDFVKLMYVSLTVGWVKIN